MHYVIVSKSQDGFIGKSGYFTARLSMAKIFDCRSEAYSYIDQFNLYDYYVGVVSEDEYKCFNNNVSVSLKYNQKYKKKNSYNEDNSYDNDNIYIDDGLEDQINHILISMDECLDKRDFVELESLRKNYDFMLWKKDLYKYWE